MKGMDEWWALWRVTSSCGDGNTVLAFVALRIYESGINEIHCTVHLAFYGWLAAESYVAGTKTKK